MVQSMLKSERSKEILQQLLRDGEVTVLELAKHFKTGPTTVRRALTDLERAGLLRRTHGGAIQVEPMFYEPFRYLPSFVGHEQFHAAEKRRIGLAAAEIVEDGETIAPGNCRGWREVLRQGVYWRRWNTSRPRINYKLAR
jgi:DeoR/GlpR family transcriptional regulator of sugar metabolism